MKKAIVTTQPIVTTETGSDGGTFKKQVFEISQCGGTDTAIVTLYGKKVIEALMVNSLVDYDVESKIIDTQTKSGAPIRVTRYTTTVTPINQPQTQPTAQQAVQQAPFMQDDPFAGGYQ